jgi:hypothetical protein
VAGHLEIDFAIALQDVEAADVAAAVGVVAPDERRRAGEAGFLQRARDERRPA